MSAAVQSWEENAMTDMVNQIMPQVGDTVYSADDHKIGTVKAFDAKFLTVEHGRLIGKAVPIVRDHAPVARARLERSCLGAGRLPQTRRILRRAALHAVR